MPMADRALALSEEFLRRDALREYRQRCVDHLLADGLLSPAEVRQDRRHTIREIDAALEAELRW